jgi:menaquinone-dependent protoporphyrinogen oxidase
MTSIWGLSTLRQQDRERHIGKEVEYGRWSAVTKILIGYGTTEGQTARIAKYIADVIRGQGHQAQVLDLKQSSDVPLDRTDAVVIGGSIHMGKHEESVGDFVRKNRATLERLPSAFFSVSLAAHGDMENARAYVENFERQTGWRPTQVGYFGGALLYRQYGIIKRLMMKRIVRDKPGNLSLDTSRDHEYTQWDDVTRFAEDFLRRLVPEDEDTVKIKS